MLFFLAYSYTESKAFKFCNLFPKCKSERIIDLKANVFGGVNITLEFKFSNSEEASPNCTSPVE